MIKKNKKDIIPYPWPCYFVPVVCLTIIGLADSIYLLIAHYRNYTDYTYSSFCALSRSINCDTVAQSSWSIIAGVPIALWGICGYLLYGLLLFLAGKNTADRMKIWSLLFLLGLLYSISSVWFGYISAVRIHSYCIMCILSYAVNFSLLFYSFIIHKRFAHTSILNSFKKVCLIIPEHKGLQSVLVFFVFLIIALKIFTVPYWKHEAPLLPDNIATGITDDGAPWIGAKDPILTIEEFTDYQCFQCAKMHIFLRRLVFENSEAIRLIHRNYPMDHEFNKLLVPEPFHVGSGRLALLAISSVKQDKFWAVNDAIFSIVREKNGSVDIAEVAGKAYADVDLLKQNMFTKESLGLLKKDITTGLKHKITGTPAYLINGEVYHGFLPSAVLQKVLSL